MAAPFPSPTKTWHDNTYPSLSPTRPELSAKGKAVLITGGGTGIGAETARYFAQAGAARIAILGRREQPLLDTKASIEQKFPGVEVFVATTDVTKESEVDAAFSKFAGNGKIDVVISNAGVSGPKEPVDIVDTEKFMQGVEQNIKGALYVGRAFLRHASADAVAVNVSSHAAHMHFGPVFASYSVAKMAAVRLWDSVAAVNPNLSIFHIQPGIVDTAMNREAGGVAAVGFEDHVSLPASFNVWLASPEARFLKGKFLWTNWDVDELKAQAKELEASTRLNISLGGWPFQDGNWSTQWSFDNAKNAD